MQHRVYQTKVIEDLDDMQRRLVDAWAAIQYIALLTTPSTNCANVSVSVFAPEADTTNMQKIKNAKERALEWSLRLPFIPAPLKHTVRGVQGTPEGDAKCVMEVKGDEI